MGLKPVSGVANAGAELAHADLHAYENESDARLREIVENAIDGIITVDERGLMIGLNPSAQRLFGYSANELIGQNVKILMPDYGKSTRNHREMREGSGQDISGRRKDGSLFPLELSVSETLRGGRRVCTCIVRDISERKRAEIERQKYASLVENNSDFIAMASLSWELLYINKAGRDLAGIGAGSIENLEVRDLWDGRELPAVLKNASPLQDIGSPVRFQNKIKNFATGEVIDVDCNTFWICDPETGDPLAMAFSLRDIRDQKHREQAVRDSEARLKAILDSAVDCIATINERGIIESVNPAVLRIFGYTAEELTGQNISILMTDPDRQRHDRYLRTYRHTGQRNIIGVGREVSGRRKDGNAFPLDLAVSEVLLAGRRLFTGIMRDITERKQIERHRNLLVAELSHRVKNTLATVISIARRTFPPEQPFAEPLATFDSRIRALAQTHTRLAEGGWGQVSLAAVVGDEISPYRNAEHSNIAVKGPGVLLNPRCAISLGMAFHELFTNAAKHGALSQEGGSIEIEWDWLRPAANQLRIRWSERGGPLVAMPTRNGFGRLLLERGLAHELRGKVQLDFAREGLQCTIVFPLDGNQAPGAEADEGV